MIHALEVPSRSRALSNHARIPDGPKHSAAKRFRRRNSASRIRESSKSTRFRLFAVGKMSALKFLFFSSLRLLISHLAGWPAGRAVGRLAGQSDR